MKSTAVTRKVHSQRRAVLTCLAGLLFCLAACSFPAELPPVPTVQPMPGAGWQYTPPASPPNLEPSPPLPIPPTPETIPVTITPTTPQASPTPEPTQAGPQTPPDRTTYWLEAVYDYAAQEVQVKQKAQYLYPGAEPVDELLLMIEANLHENGFKLQSVQAGPGRAITGWRLNEHLLWLSLDTPVNPGEWIELNLEFSLRLPDKAETFGYTKNQANLAGWFPVFPPYHPSLGWLAYLPSDIGEFTLYELAAFEVSLFLLNPPERLTVVASAPPTEENPPYYRYSVPMARNFTLSLGSRYQTLTTQVGDITLSSYTFPEFAEAGQAALDHAAAALALYSQLFGPYPHPSLALVTSDFEDGMEYDGLVFIGQEYYALYSGDPRTWLTLITVHEVSHQWWQGVVGSNQALHPWLDEALATFSELLYLEKNQPDLVEWWWNFRVHRYEPWKAGPVDSTVYQFGYPRPYIDSVYLRGVYFLNEIRLTIGTDRFQQALFTYAQSQAGQQAEPQDLLDAFRSATQADLEPVFQKYLENTP